MPTKISDLLGALEKIAPAELAEDWDNTGLLVDAPGLSEVTHGTLTIDLSEAVLDEAIANGSQVVIAYHPPLFQPVRRLSASIKSQRVLLRAIREGIALYSPHTALDAAPGGVNDWLASAFAGARVEAIPAATPDGIPLGRRVTLAEPSPLDDCIATIKRHLDLDHVRVAVAAEHEAGAKIHSVALCAGAGSSVISGERADLLWTGEMRHHDVLAALDRGSSVVLCDHTNTERGYLPTLREKLAKACPGTEFSIAGSDREPLRVT